MINKQNIQNEYQKFLSQADCVPPQRLSQNILKNIHQCLHPAAWLVFLKLSIFHFVIACLTLALCPQFGVRFFGSGQGLPTYFMFLGPYGCEFLCGCFFIGTTFLLVGLLFKPEEIRTIRTSWPLYTGSLIMLSLGSFLMISPKIVIGFALAWILGGLMGGLALLNIGWMGKKLLYNFS
ncbi:MAG: hypothetical protein HYS98_03625 [Deltaproteobacteria bacterium]|nr:hypothetical protein [Deltaproteobacteria bacterium]